MKRKIDLKIILIIILIILLITIIYLYFNNSDVSTNTAQESLNSTSTISENATISEAQVETKTIMKTISSTGEISSNLKEKLELHATYYYSEIYYSENEYVKEGENILKYTNGTYMVAPYNCVITSINVPNQNSQCTNKHYIEVQSTDILTMSLKIDEDELSTISIGKEVQIQVLALENKIYKGYVTNIGSTATYSSNGSKFTIIAQFNNDGNILLGMTATCSVILDKVENVLAVPIEAVTTNNNNSYVTIINEDKTTKNVTVETGLSNDAYIEIKSGLSNGETVQIVKEESTSSTNTRNQNSMKQNMQGGERPDMQSSSGIPSEVPSGSMPQMSK